MRQTGLARTIGRRVSALTTLGDGPHDSDEEKLQHHYLMYMGLLMAGGGIIWGSLSASYGLWVPSTIPFGYTVLTILNFSYFHASRNFRRVRFFQVFGSSRRSKYAVVGSGVNMTSRIESYSVGGEILISESVRQAAGDVLRIDGQRDVLPKGAEAPLRIYVVGGIAGAYNLALEGKDFALVTLAQEIPLRYAVLEGKDVGRTGLAGAVLRLARNAAEIRLATPAESMTNLKMNLEDVDETLAARDAYGKVTRAVDESAQTYLVHFTSVPPEVDAYFQAHLRYAEKTLAGSRRSGAG